MNVTSLIGNKVKLNNGTVVLDTQKTSTSSKPEEARVVLFSVQYESGLVKLIIVNYMSVIIRVQAATYLIS